MDQNTYPSHGWTNPDLDAYASTCSFGIPERHLYVHAVTIWWLMQSKLLPVIVIRYDLTVKGLGYYALLDIVVLSFVGESYCNTYVGCVSITLFIQWHDTIINWHKCSWSVKFDHQLTSDLICLHTTCVLIFLLNTIIAWQKTYYEH
jgi:hypothetical protein